MKSKNIELDKIKCWNCKFSWKPEEVLIDLEENANCPNCKHNLHYVAHQTVLQVLSNHRLLHEEMIKRRSPV